MKNQLKDIIKKQIPDHIRHEYPKFVAFFQAYFEWLELQGNPADVIRNFSGYLDIDKSIEAFVDNFRNEIIPNLPTHAASDKRLYLKYIDDIFASKGSIQSYKLLFRMLFNEDVEIYYPKADILRVSDGKWIQAENSIKCTATNDPNVFLYRKIEQRDYTLDGQGNTVITVTASATVDRVRQDYSNNYTVNELFISNITGTFVHGKHIEFWDGVTKYSENVIPTITGYTINNAGGLAAKYDKIPVDSDGTYERVWNYDNISSVYDTGVTTNFTNDQITVELNSVPMSTSDFDFDGRVLTISKVLAYQDEIKFISPGRNLYIQVGEVGLTGEIKSVLIRDYGFAYTNAPTIHLENVGNGTADIDVNIGTVINYAGYYLNNDGHLDSNKVIQDSYYYQDYSYVIKSNRHIQEYKEIVKRMLHPAGMNLFGSIDMVLLLSSNYNIVSDYNTFPITTISVESELYNSSGNELSWLDVNKFELDGNHPLHHFLSLQLTDVINEPRQHTQFVTDADIVIS